MAGFDNKYPYTDFHELNLDWFLARFKEVTDQVTTLDATVQQFTEFVTNYFENLDVQQEINKKLDEMYASGELSSLIENLFSDFKDEINDEISAQNTVISGQNSRITTLEGRMDTFSTLTEGSTTGDAELADIRVGANGVTYPSAGDAVRGQFSELSDELNDYMGIINIRWILGYDNISTGVIYPSNHAGIHTNFIPVTPNEKIYVVPTSLSGYSSHAIFYSSNTESSYVSYLTITGEKSFVVPATAHYVILQIYKSGATMDPAYGDILPYRKTSYEADLLSILQPDAPDRKILRSVLNKYTKHYSVPAGSQHNQIIIDLPLIAGCKVFFDVENEVNVPTGSERLNIIQVRDDQNNFIDTSATSKKFSVTGVDTSYIKYDQWYRANLTNQYSCDVTVYVISAYQEQYSNIIPTGTHTEIYEGFTDKEIYGASSIGTIIKDSSGNYDTPPIEISGGKIGNVSIIEDGGHTEHSAYCIHTDNAANEDNTLIIENCYLESNSNHCIGIGTRQGYNLILRNCVLKITDNSDRICCIYAHNSTNTDLDPTNKSKLTFINCIFISDTGLCARFQDWKGSTIDTMVLEFINCTFAPASGSVDDSVSLEYKDYTPEELDSHTFKNKIELSSNSTGNNVTWLNTR